jgi:hypothetical protein
LYERRLLIVFLCTVCAVQWVSETSLAYGMVAKVPLRSAPHAGEPAADADGDAPEAQPATAASTAAVTVHAAPPPPLPHAHKVVRRAVYTPVSRPLNAVVDIASPWETTAQAACRRSLAAAAADAASKRDAAARGTTHAGGDDSGAGVAGKPSLLSQHVLDASDVVQHGVVRKDAAVGSDAPVTATAKPAVTATAKPAVAVATAPASPPHAPRHTRHVSLERRSPSKGAAATATATATAARSPASKKVR